MIATAFGAQVIAIDIDDNTLEKARQLGAVATINARTNENDIEQVKSISKGEAHLSIDALGSQITCFNSITNLRKLGKHIQVGLMSGKESQPNIPFNLVMANKLEIIGSHGMRAHKYWEMLEMISNGKLKPEQLIEKTISLQEANVALTQMNSFKNKGVLVINKF